MRSHEWLAGWTAVAAGRAGYFCAVAITGGSVSLSRTSILFLTVAYETPSRRRDRCRGRLLRPDRRRAGERQRCSPRHPCGDGVHSMPFYSMP